MKILSATVRDTPTALTTKTFTETKGHSMSYEAGVLTVRAASHPDKVFLFPASNVIVMEAEDTKKK